MALDMLQTCAPRAWCKRMLCWEIFWGRLDLYARDGEITHRRSAFEILEDAGINYSKRTDLTDNDIESRFDDDETANAVRKAVKAQTPYEQIDFYTVQWSIHDGPLPSAVVLALDYLDFENETLSGDYNGWLPDHWLDENEAFAVDKGGEIWVSLTGLSFQTHAIEMMVPSTSVPAVAAEQRSRKDARTGRPQKWDWEGALASVAAEANRNPDGLPEGYGAMAAVEKMIADWFVERTGGSPAESEVRRRAKLIISAVEKGR